MRKTKIICTLGPACRNDETLAQMCEAGMNIARLNFSHGDHKEQQENIDLVKRVREKLNLPIAIMLDTKGPEYRIKTFENGKVFLNDGQTFTFTTDEVEGDETRVSVNYKELIKDLGVGDRILVNNGLLIFEVRELTGNDAICEVVTGGELSNRKSMNFPNKVMKHKFLSDKDKEDLLLGIKNEIDFVAASFVSQKQDLCDMRQFLDDHGGQEIEIIAKIENSLGVKNLEEICEIADGIMIARGDLGVEIPFMQVPSVQKYIIRKCRELGVRVITATEMLESMIQNPRPTRAELSDVANAVYDGTSAIMLSGETAAGKYPVQAVKNMSEIAEFTENSIDYKKRFRESDFKIENMVSAIAHSTCALAIDVGAKCVVVNSLSGRTIRMVSRFRCPADVIGMTISEKAWRKLNLNWGVIPVLCERYDMLEDIFDNAMEKAQEICILDKGEHVILTGGLINGQTGNTNIIKVETV